VRDAQSFKTTVGAQVKDFEAQVLKLKRDLSAKNDELGQAVSQKNACEVLLEKARTDKKVVDESIASLQSQMNQVQSNFRQMRQDLVEKKSLVDKYTAENESLKEKLTQVEEQYRHFLAETEHA